MTDDLVKRLRGYPVKLGLEKLPHVTMDEAADRIEKLEAALREIGDTFWEDTQVCRMVNRALERKDG